MELKSFLLKWWKSYANGMATYVMDKEDDKNKKASILKKW